MKLNDLFFMASRELETYIQTANERFLINSAKYYITYKKQGGKKTIARLEELIYYE